MATPYKLPSGTWCIKPYSHEEPVYNADGSPVLLPNGEQKTTRKYKTITGPTKKSCRARSSAVYATKRRRT